MAKARIELARRLVVLWVSLASIGAASAVPFAAAFPGVSPEEASGATGGFVARGAASFADLRMKPAGVDLGALAAALATRAAWPVLIEGVYLLPKTEVPAWNDLRAYNALTKVSTLSGITYDSFTRNKETVLFDDVYRVEGPGSRKRLPESDVAALPRSASFDVHLNDVNFGSCWYRVDFSSAGGTLRLSLTNTRPIGILMVRAFDVSALRIELTMVPVDEGVAFYGVCAGDTAPLAGRIVDMFSAVLKRMDSVRKWAVQRLKSAR